MFMASGLWYFSGQVLRKVVRRSGRIVFLALNRYSESKSDLTPLQESLRFLACKCHEEDLLMMWAFMVFDPRGSGSHLGIASGRGFKRH